MERKGACCHPSPLSHRRRPRILWRAWCPSLLRPRPCLRHFPPPWLCMKDTGRQRLSKWYTANTFSPASTILPVCALITLFFSPFLSWRHFPALNCQLPPITPDDTFFQERQLCSLLLKLLFPCLLCKFVTCLQSITLLTCPFWSIRAAQFLGYRLSVSPSCPFRFDLSHQMIAPWFLDFVLRVASSTQTTICCLRPSYDRRQRGGKLQHSKACLDKH